MRKLLVAGRIGPREIGGSFASVGQKVRAVDAFGETPDGFKWKGTQYVSLEAPPFASSYALEKIFRGAADLCGEGWFE